MFSENQNSMNALNNNYVYVDLNDNTESPVVNPLFFKRVIDAYGAMTHDMQINIWSDDVDENGNPDPFIGEAKLKYDINDKRWFLDFDINQLKHFSEIKDGFSVSAEEFARLNSLS